MNNCNAGPSNCIQDVRTAIFFSLFCSKDHNSNKMAGVQQQLTQIAGIADQKAQSDAYKQLLGNIQTNAADLKTFLQHSKDLVCFAWNLLK